MSPRRAVKQLQREPVRAVIILMAMALLISTVAVSNSSAKSTRIITIGETNSQAQKDELLDLFAAENGDKIITVTFSDTVKAMDGIFDMSAFQPVAFSSTALTCRELGEGLDVTTNNIQLVTPGLYAMALVTAGIGDAELVVAAPAGISGVEGMTALTGVFKTWDLAPCDSGNTNADRQRLALEELTLAVQIGTALGAAGVPDGVQRATDVVLQTQKTIVTDQLRGTNAIANALTGAERQIGIAIPGQQRAELVKLLVRLAEEDINWSTFASGWTIDTNATNTRITMRGEGIAIRRAQQTATAMAMNQTATARAALTATARAGEARLTATAQAGAAMTATANAAAMTATAAARPTATPVPTQTPVPVATATPSPYGISGQLTAVSADSLSVKAPGEVNPVEYVVATNAQGSLDGKPAPVSALRSGDRVELTLNGSTNQVVQVTATRPEETLLDRLARFWWIALAGFVVPSALIARRSRAEEPFVVRESSR